MVIIFGQPYVMELYDIGSVCLAQKLVYCLPVPLEFGLGKTRGAPSKYRKPPQTTPNHRKPPQTTFLYMITVESGGNGWDIATIRASLAFKYASVGMEGRSKCYRRTRLKV